jgi:cysteine desulfurase
MQADTAALSAHKLGGPQGVGALVMREADTHIGDRLLRGGGQERGVRAGTENVPGIGGFAAAARAAMASLDQQHARLSALRDALEQGIRALAPDTVIFAAGTARLPNTTLFALPGLAAATALIAFDLDGVALSSGSACSSGKVRSSHVLDAMGVERDIAQGALRVSLGWNNSNDDVIRFLRAFEKGRDVHKDRMARRAA